VGGDAVEAEKALVKGDSLEAVGQTDRKMDAAVLDAMTLGSWVANQSENLHCLASSLRCSGVAPAFEPLNTPDRSRREKYLQRDYDYDDRGKPLTLGRGRGSGIARGGREGAAPDAEDWNPCSSCTRGLSVIIGDGVVDCSGVLDFFVRLKKCMLSVGFVSFLGVVREGTVISVKETPGNEDEDKS
jgi:hypothetical protein